MPSDAVGGLPPRPGLMVAGADGPRPARPPGAARTGPVGAPPGPSGSRPSRLRRGDGGPPPGPAQGGSRLPGSGFGLVRPDRPYPLGPGPVLLLRLPSLSLGGAAVIRARYPDSA